MSRMHFRGVRFVCVASLAAGAYGWAGHPGMPLAMPGRLRSNGAQRRPWEAANGSHAQSSPRLLCRARSLAAVIRRMKTQRGGIRP